jgi:hypothetical protein
MKKMIRVRKFNSKRRKGKEYDLLLYTKKYRVEGQS